jgi:hypothetical protein
MRRRKRDHGWYFKGGILNPTIFIQSLRSTVRKHDAHYQRAREREPVLAPFATGAVLFDALSTESTLDSDARQALLRVVVLEYQSGRHPLWHALAVRGLEPMLARLRSDLRRLDEDDCEQALHTALIEGIGRLRVHRDGAPGFPLLTLRRGIERALIAAERAKRELGDGEVTFDECADACAPSPHQDPPQFVQCLARELGELIARRRGGEDAVRVLAGAETLAEQAERLSSTEVSYDCLQKRHRRALDGVRRDLSGRRS